MLIFRMYGISFITGDRITGITFNLEDTWGIRKRVGMTVIVWVAKGKVKRIPRGNRNTCWMWREEQF